MLVIRLFRTGKRNQPSFKIVVTDKRKSSTRGRSVEEVGFWNPITKEKALKQERIKYWLSVGAQPSATVFNLLVSAKIIEGKKKIDVHKKPKKKAASAPAGAPASQGEKPAEAPAAEKKPEKVPEEKPAEPPAIPAVKEEKPAPEVAAEKEKPVEKKPKDLSAEASAKAEEPKTEKPAETKPEEKKEL